MRFSDLMELHMMAWVIGGWALYGYAICAQLATLIHKGAS